jgi:hypothetical protein
MKTHVRTLFAWFRAVSVLVYCLGLATFTEAATGRNLLTNGDFEGGLNEQGEPVGWHTRITGVIPIPEYRDPANKKGRTGVVHFRCGCGADWGTVRPWAMLICPQCKHLNPGLEDSGGLYQGNHRCVGLVGHHRGKAIHFTLPEAVGNSQGVRVVSHMIQAEHGASYEIRFEAMARGSHLRVFVEGFRLVYDDSEAAAWLRTLPSHANPNQHTMRLKRVYRKQVNVGSPPQWQRFAARFVPPERRQFDYMFVNLYAYLPGEAAYDHVQLRKLSPGATPAYPRQERRRKERRPR